jgi:hypothetical protein
MKLRGSWRWPLLQQDWSGPLMLHTLGRLLDYLGFSPDFLFLIVIQYIEAKSNSVGGMLMLSSPGLHLLVDGKMACRWKNGPHTIGCKDCERLKLGPPRPRAHSNQPTDPTTDRLQVK